MGLELALSADRRLRSSAQMVSYEVAMGLAVVSVIMMTSLNATGHRHAQHDRHRAGAAGAGSLVHLQILPARPDRIFIFAIAMVAETNARPSICPKPNPN
jgi:NADH-quinone oxidoreductase subunit H